MLHPTQVASVKRRGKKEDEKKTSIVPGSYDRTVGDLFVNILNQILFLESLYTIALRHIDDLVIIFHMLVRMFKYNGGHSREIYRTKRMQRVFCVKFSSDASYVISGSDDTNL